uniref:Uncharacterized protein n=1 Tax=Myotis myotis TaxID=51298 RepID=A0A7J7SC52_MYOMY|nr:hypothetical protein mMyoMyo1_009541 [Myotis myotis]
MGDVSIWGPAWAFCRAAAGWDVGAVARMHPSESVAPPSCPPDNLCLTRAGEESQADSNEGSVHAHFRLPLISSLPSSLPPTISSFQSRHKQLSLRPWAGWGLCPRRGFLTPPLTRAPQTDRRTDRCPSESQGRLRRGRAGGTSPAWGQPGTSVKAVLPREVPPLVTMAGLFTVSRGSFPPVGPSGPLVW